MISLDFSLGPGKDRTQGSHNMWKPQCSTLGHVWWFAVKPQPRVGSLVLSAGLLTPPGWRPTLHDGLGLTFHPVRCWHMGPPTLTVGSGPPSASVVRETAPFPVCRDVRSLLLCMDVCF